MSASLSSRQRLVIRMIAPALLAAGLGVSLLLGGIARSGLIGDAAGAARATAEGALAPLLTQKDLRAPITGRRYAQLERAVADRITGPGPIEQVRLWSAQGRDLFDTDRALVGTRDPSLHDVLSQASSGGLLHRVAGDELQTFVRIAAGGTGPAAVAELDRPLGPVVAGASWWRIPQIAFAALFALALLFVALGVRRQRRPEPVAYVPPRPWKRPATEAPPRQASTERPSPRIAAPAPATAVTREEPSAREQAAREPAPRPVAAPAPERGSAPDEALAAAEARARAAEQNYWGLQEQYRQALREIAELESRAEERESTSEQGQEEVRALREQVREMVERLEAEERERSALGERLAAAELDANALRERLTLQRTQLDELTGQLRTAEERAARLEAEVQEWREQAGRLEVELRDARAEVEEVRFRTRASGLAAFRELNEEEPEEANREDVVVDTDDRGPRVIIGMPSIPPAPDLAATRPPAESGNEVHPAGA